MKHGMLSHRTGIAVPAVVFLVAAFLTVSAAPSRAQEPGSAVHFEEVSSGFDTPFEIEGFSFMPGAAFIDLDNDTLVDLYFVNGKGKPNALYRNLGDGRWLEMAAAAGVADTRQGTGTAVGDINNDGFDDLYVANGATVGDGIESLDGQDRLYLNNGDGTFTDITETSGIVEPGFSTSAAFGDYDGDGFLDLFVGRFVDFDFFVSTANHTNPTVPSHLYRNNGDGTFTDVTASSGIEKNFNTWAMAWADFDRDGDLDLFQGHEQGPLSIFSNNGDGTFTDLTETAGDVVYHGAWMGIAVGDYNNDGWLDIYASNISDLWVTRDQALPALPVPPPETWGNPWPTLFRNNGDGTFTNVGVEAGVSIPQEFSWGTEFADFDNDGLLDIYLAQNFSPVGVIGTEPQGAAPGGLFLNQGDGTFREITVEAGAANTDADGLFLDGRGMAIADFDKDGQMDFVLQNAPQFLEAFPFGSTPIPGTGTPKLFRNLGTDNHWLELRLIGTPPSNRNAIGARVEAETKTGTQVRFVIGGGSVYSASERIVHFGLGDAETATVRVAWPDGTSQVFAGMPADHRFTLTQGSPQRIPESAFEAGSR